MKVFSKATGETRLVGRCDVLDDGELAFDATEPGVLLVPGQDSSLLPRWQPLAS